MSIFDQCGQPDSILAAVPAEAVKTPTTNSEASSPTTTNTVFREISPGVFELGSIRLHKPTRTVTFPAAVNLHETPVEYLVVTDFGKVHESVLRTAVPPYQLHVAMLLLGAQGAGTNAWPEDPTLPLPGDTIHLLVRWKDEASGAEKSVSAESLVLNRRQQTPMTQGPWTYTASLIFEGSFLAQQEGSIVSIISDPAALVNNPRLGREDDENWLPNAAALPPLETVVQVEIQLVSPPTNSIPKTSPKEIDKPHPGESK